MRMATRATRTGGWKATVVAFDDVTQLVSARAWPHGGDVARRIAHEITEPPDPHPASAERINRRYSKELEGEEKAKLEEPTGITCARPTTLRRIVDEFSKFARMPEPETRIEDLRSCSATP